jgi:hypothetical protein
MGMILEALEHCAGFEARRVHVFCDGARSRAHEPSTGKAREVARRWCLRTGARLVVRPLNVGLRNMTDGITELCAEEGSAVSLEDDHLVEPSFLSFLDRALARYRDDERVFQVAAHRFGPPLQAPPTFFLPWPMAAGWGTWSRAWARFTWDVGDARDILGHPRQRECFDQDGVYPASRLLERAIAGHFESYFIYWYVAVFRAGGLALCPRRSLVRNIGLEGGIHGSPGFASSRELLFNGAWSEDVADDPALWSLPSRVEVDVPALATLREFLRARYLASLAPTSDPR